MNWRIQFVFFINVSWLTSVCKWGTLICSPCSRVILYFFPWLKRTFLMWHPPSAHIRTHEHARGELEGGVRAVDTQPVKHEPLTTDNNSTCECPLKDAASALQLAALTKLSSSTLSQENSGSYRPSWGKTRGPAVPRRRLCYERQLCALTVHVPLFSNLYDLIISWHVLQCCLIKTIGSSDTSKTTKTSFSIFSRRFACCLYSLWFNIQRGSTCTHKHGESSARSHKLISLGFSSILSLIISGICDTMEVYYSHHLNVLSSFLSYQW